MRHRLATGLTDRATVYRRETVGENEIGEDEYAWVLVTDDTPCQFDDESTDFVRESSGERVRTPATATFGHAVDVEESDRVTVAGGWYSITGIDEVRDHRRGTIASIVAELQESDPLDESDITTEA